MTIPLRWVMLLVLFLVRLAMGYQFQSAKPARYLAQVLFCSSLLLAFRTPMPY